ncbi:MAG TPA: hypothetical protein VII75_09375 [Thermoanaerobaculia bacterium]
MLPLLLVAGIMYHFTTSFIDRHGEVQSSGRVYADGDRYRLDLDPAPGRTREFDVVISNDADRTAFLINTAKKKYQDRVRVSAKTRSSILFQFPFPGGETVGQPAIDVREAGIETIAGHPAKKYVIDVEYRMSAEDDEDTKINATVHATQTLWCAEDLPRLPFERELTTGWTAVDRDLKPVTSAIPGMTLASDLVVTRTFEGGPPIKETTHTSIDEMKIARVAPETFAIPKDYVYDGAPLAPKSR